MENKDPFLIAVENEIYDLKKIAEASEIRLATLKWVLDNYLRNINAKP